MTEAAATGDVRQLIAALRSREPAVRVEAVEGLGRIGGLVAFMGVMKGVRDANDNVRLTAVKVLGDWQDTQAVAVLCDVVQHDRESRVRAGAAFALGRIGVSGAVDALDRALGDADRDVRFWAAGALGSIGDRRAVPALVRTMARDDDHRVQVSAARALGSIRSLDAEWPLSEAFSGDGPWDLRAAAARSLELLRHPAVGEGTVGEELLRVTHGAPVNRAVFSSTGGLVATAGNDGTARLWSAVDGTERLRVTHGGRVLGVAMGPDERLLATVGDDGLVRIWGVDDGEERTRVDGSVFVALSLDGARLATRGRDGTLRVCDPDSGDELLRWPALRRPEDGAVLAAAFSRQGDRLALTIEDEGAYVIDSRSGRERLHAYSDVGCVALSPDDGRLATCGSGGSVQVWDAVTGGRQYHVDFGSPTRNVAFSPDGQRLAAACEDGTARVLDSSTGKRQLRVRHQTGGAVQSVAFSPGGVLMVTAGQDGTARVWVV